MQSIIYNQSLKTSSNIKIVSTSLVKSCIIALLFCAGMLMTNQAKAQLDVGVIEIVMFAPPSGNNHNQLGFGFKVNPEFQISPNPASSHITIGKEPGVTIERLEIVNTQGNIIFSGNFLNEQLYIPQINPGLYSFRIYSDAGANSKWVSIE